LSVPVVRRLLLPVLAALCAPSAAVAAPSTGGAMAEEPPEVSTLECATSDVGACPAGQTLRVRGDNLGDARAVVFLGGRGSKDDRRARPSKASTHRLLVKVPGAAHSGPLKVLASDASVTGPRLKVLPKAVKAPAADLEPAAAADPPAGGVFPVRGKHTFGTGTAAFGGGRGHQGEDVFAACGTPLVAALSGDVTITKWQDRAGNYVVIKADDGTSQAYMHLKAPATVARGDRVEAGDPIGQVGDTGDAQGCHLHFELWTAPGWYEGGEPLDPLPLLERLDGVST
jgi:murein DD-endopeptidase MepM/ murein hydrolase activator NlpD